MTYEAPGKICACLENYLNHNHVQIAHARKLRLCLLKRHTSVALMSISAWIPILSLKNALV